MTLSNSSSAMKQLSISVAVGMAGSTTSKVGITSAVLTCEAMTSAVTYGSRGATRARMTASFTINFSKSSANSKTASLAPVLDHDRRTFRVGGNRSPYQRKINA